MQRFVDIRSYVAIAIDSIGISKNIIIIVIANELQLCM